ncbi:MAG: hypothetical protein HC921_15825 [Synechococcaceae cyanobacterium SM2_3_1]|nr:hypothetical protein [Synechococcaceae cyanobacterium SM2_3_1]
MDQAELVFLDVAPSFNTWQPHNIISTMNKEFYAIYDQMDRVDQLKILELLDPFGQTENKFWCCHRGQQQAAPAQDSFNSTTWIANPLFLEHARATALDLNVRQLLDQPQKLPGGHTPISWQLFPTETQYVKMSTYQLFRVLALVADRPRQGDDLLAMQEEDVREKSQPYSRTGKQHASFCVSNPDEGGALTHLQG